MTFRPSSSTYIKKDSMAMVREHICPLCRGVLTKPMTDNCGANFCLNCIKQCLHNTGKCAICLNRRTLANFTHNTDKEWVLRSTKVNCDFAEQGCRWNGLLENYNQHSSGCGLKFYRKQSDLVYQYTKRATKIGRDGSKYEGLLVNGFRFGLGKLTHPSGSIYKGFFRKNKKHGRGIISTPENHLWFAGEWVDDKLLRGKGTLKLKDCRISGNVLDYKYQGKVFVKYKNGNIYKGTINTDLQPEGYGMIYYKKSGFFYKGNFSKGKKNGEGVLFFLEDGMNGIAKVWMFDYHYVLPETEFSKILGNNSHQLSIQLAITDNGIINHGVKYLSNEELESDPRSLDLQDFDDQEHSNGQSFNMTGEEVCPLIPNTDISFKNMPGETLLKKRSYAKFQQPNEEFKMMYTTQISSMTQALEDSVLGTDIEDEGSPSEPNKLCPRRKHLQLKIIYAGHFKNNSKHGEGVLYDDSNRVQHAGNFRRGRAIRAEH